MNRNRELAQFWIMWSIKKHFYGFTWREFLSYFEDGKFIESLKKLISDEFNKVSLFEGDNSEFTEEGFYSDAEILEDKWNEDGIRSIVSDDFNQFPSLKRVKGANFFFYKGDINVLNNNISDFVSVVGSRSTPASSKHWILNNVPKDKIIISGLADGADVFGHEVAIGNMQKIVIFPAISIYKFKAKTEKMKIFDYAKTNGIILTDVVPGSSGFSETNFLKRNKWMAQMVDATYVVYFKGISGTLGQVLEVVRNGGKVIMPKQVLDDNLEFLSTHKAFKEIIDATETSDNE